ncbi:MAG: conjugal transfer protein TraD [Sphingomicrobium sp.]
MARRERTRHLIELGGLVQKAGLVELAADDRQTLYGAFLDVAMRMRGDDSATTKALLKRLGAHVFATEAEQAAEAGREKMLSAFRQRNDAE